MNNNVYNPYMINQQQNYYGPGYYQYNNNPINYNIPNYNMGYYNNNYMGGGYFNPYLMQKQREKQIEEERKRQQYQSDIMKRLSKSSHKVLGIYDEEKFQEHSKQYNPLENNMSNEEYIEYTQMKTVAHIHELSKIQNNPDNNYNIYENQKIDRINTNINKNKNKYGLTDNMSMIEYFEVAGSILIDQKIENTKRGNRNMGNLYNRESYGKLIDLHSGKHNYFNSIGDHNNLGRLKHHNIDDMEVTLPSNMSEQYAKRKAEFISQLLNG